MKVPGLAILFEVEAFTVMVRANSQKPLHRQGVTAVRSGLYALLELFKVLIGYRSFSCQGFRWWYLVPQRLAG
jgi:hypothetical protein